jgi:DNA-binding LacI/PurR family transcriptional regulator
MAAGSNTIRAGQAAAAELLVGTAPSAIAAISDVLALGALRTVRAATGRPLAVTGFDDVPDAATAGLTTMRQPTLEKGRLMGRMLLDPAFTQRRVQLPARLVVRDSTQRAAPSVTQAPGLRSETMVRATDRPQE